jgi:hypothetical protein
LCAVRRGEAQNKTSGAKAGGRGDWLALPKLPCPAADQRPGRRENPGGFGCPSSMAPRQVSDGGQCDALIGPACTIGA